MTVKAVSKVSSIPANVEAERLPVNSHTVRKPRGRVKTWLKREREFISHQEQASSTSYKEIYQFRCNGNDDNEEEKAEMTMTPKSSASKSHAQDIYSNEEISVQMYRQL